MIIRFVAKERVCSKSMDPLDPATSGNLELVAGTWWGFIFEDFTVLAMLCCKDHLQKT